MTLDQLSGLDRLSGVARPVGLSGMVAPAEAGWSPAGGMARPGDGCDASIAPIVVGHVDHELLDRISAALFRTGSTGGQEQDADAGDPGSRQRHASHAGGREQSGREQNSREQNGREQNSREQNSGEAGGRERDAGEGGEHGSARAERLVGNSVREIVLRQAIALLSGPSGLAAYLRSATPTEPAASISLPLDVGPATETIPAHLRRAVIRRDRIGCGRPTG